MRNIVGRRGRQPICMALALLIVLASGICSLQKSLKQGKMYNSKALIQSYACHLRCKCHLTKLNLCQNPIRQAFWRHLALSVCCKRQHNAVCSLAMTTSGWICMPQEDGHLSATVNTVRWKVEGRKVEGIQSGRRWKQGLGEQSGDKDREEGRLGLGRRQFSWQQYTLKPYSFISLILYLEFIWICPSNTEQTWQAGTSLPNRYPLTLWMTPGANTLLQGTQQDGATMVLLYSHMGSQDGLLPVNVFWITACNSVILSWE